MKLHMKKAFVLMLSLAMIFTVTAGSTMAFLVDKTGSITNSFEAAYVSVTRNNSEIVNNSNMPVYIRALVVATWQSREGIYYTAPAVSVHRNEWMEGSDGYYYYPFAVEAGASIPNLSASTTEAAPNAEYTFTYEVLAEAIQALPSSAVEGAWGVTVASNGTISK